MSANNWEKLTLQQIWTIEDLINESKIFTNTSKVEEILDIFERMGYPLLWDKPSFYNQFCADTPYNQELIEDYLYDQN